MNWKERWRALPNQWKIVFIVVGMAILLRSIGLFMATPKLRVISINPIISGGFIDSPAWSPDGKEIAFSTSGAMWIINSDGTGVKRILKGYPNLTCISDLSWSSKGIIFGAAPGPNIWFVDSQGKNLRQLKENGGLPSWSPDGKRIVYNGYKFGEKVYKHGGRELIGDGIWIMDHDGKSPHKLIPIEGFSFPSWLPNGSKIAFVGEKDGKDAIFVADSDGGNINLLTKEFVGSIHHLSWSPDGEWIVYTYMMAFGANREIKVVRTDGRCKQTLTRPQIDAYDPSWSPDGSRIAFVKAQPGGYSGEDTYSICIMTLER